MNTFIRPFTLLLFACLLINGKPTNGQTSRDALLRMSQEYDFAHKAEQEKIRKAVQQKGWPFLIQHESGIWQLHAIDASGQPVYIQSHSLAAARTTSTDRIWEGGLSGLNLTGERLPAAAIGMWEIGSGRLNHREYNGRVVQQDNGRFNNEVNRSNDHATHVAGTIVSSGLNPLARGMAGKARLNAYTQSNSYTEMSQAAANGMLVSNHSYGISAGWSFDVYGDRRWVWYGNTATSETEDFKFGWYNNDSRELDRIVFTAPDYLPVFSAGNDRNDTGPLPGVPHWAFNSRGDTVLSTTRRNPDGILGGYKTVGPYAVAKNVLTVGAVEALTAPYSAPSDVEMSEFSSWGPTSDGRIKPDVVANGVNVFSALSSAENAYGFQNGTSMSAPNATGSLALIQELHHQRFGRYMRAATLKALAIHTADEAGPSPGPDYMFGWGLLNAANMADAVNGGGSYLFSEHTLTNSNIFQLQVFANGFEPLVATICWTDPAGEVQPSVLNPTGRNLVNDLDIRISRDGQTFLPYVLDPANPPAPATRGDNVRDNVEQVYVANPTPGSYTIRVTHKGTLNGNSQAFSLVVSGQTNFERDARIVSISTETDPCSYSAQTPVRIEVANNGRTAFQALAVAYRIKNAGGEVLRSGTVTVPSVPLGGSNVANLTVDLSGNDEVIIEATINAPEDQNTRNNQLAATFIPVRIDPARPSGYTLDLEDPDQLLGWRTINSNNDQTAGGIPQQWNYIDDGPNARTGRGYFSYFGAGTTVQADDWIMSTCLNLRAGVQYRVGFWYRQRDSGARQRMTFRLGTDPAPEAMTTILHRFDSITNVPYQFYQTFFTVPANGQYHLGWHVTSPADQGNFYIDDISLSVAPQVDAELASLVYQGSSCDLSVESPVRVEVVNRGLGQLTGAELVLTVRYENNTTSTTRRTLATLASGASISQTLLADLSKGRTFTITASVEAANDAAPGNNSQSIQVSGSFEVTDTRIFREGFESRANVSEWRIQDANGDGQTWDFLIPGNPAFANTGTGFVISNPSASLTANDWLFSTCFFLRAGQQYAVSFHYRAFTRSAPVSVRLAAGRQRGASNMTIPIRDFGTLSNENYLKGIATFEVPTDGTYYIGWQVYHQPNANAVFIMDDVEVGTATVLSTEAPFDLTSTTPFMIYPNPSDQGDVRIRWESAYIGPVRVRMYDLTGRLLREEQVNKQQETLELEWLSQWLQKGLYLIEMEAGTYRDRRKWLRE